MRLDRFHSLDEGSRVEGGLELGRDHRFVPGLEVEGEYPQVPRLEVVVEEALASRQGIPDGEQRVNREPDFADSLLDQDVLRFICIEIAVVELPVAADVQSAIEAESVARCDHVLVVVVGVLDASDRFRITDTQVLAEYSVGAIVVEHLSEEEALVVVPPVEGGDVFTDFLFEVGLGDVSDVPHLEGAGVEDREPSAASVEFRVGHPLAGIGGRDDVAFAGGPVKDDNNRQPPIRRGIKPGRDVCHSRAVFGKRRHERRVGLRSDRLDLAVGALLEDVGLVGPGCNRVQPSRGLVLVGARVLWHRRCHRHRQKNGHSNQYENAGLHRDCLLGAG